MSDQIEEKMLELSNRVFALEKIIESRPVQVESFQEQVIKCFFSGITTPLYQKYVHYALNSLQRGENTVKSFKKGDTGSFLDIGCAWGGSAIAMAQAGVSRCVGMDVTDHYLKYARVLAKEKQIHDKVDFCVADLTDFSTLSSLGQFDLIMCTDVIEHVCDPEVAIENLAKLANRQGVVIFDVPNKMSVERVYADPHHQLLGSVLLPFDSAKAVFFEQYPNNFSYTVGHFQMFEWYHEKLSNAGFEIEMRNPLQDTDESRRQLKNRADGLKAELSRVSVAQEWSGSRKSLISEAIMRYLEQFNADYESNISNKDFFRRYAIETYKLTLTKL